MKENIINPIGLKGKEVLSRVRELMGESVEIMSDNELVEIIVASEHKKGQMPEKKNSFFDIVDLCLYRAN